ncbi:hypothetical protein BC827DRAFT_1269509 [Russula dissimulans]|nr:hypothetical protein BC827DRAFT_1269509 [Russula dissimulans]
MLAKIVEDEALDEGDRTIGDYTIDDEQWLEWKRGGRAPSPVDEYESDESDGMATTMTAGSEATCSKSASIRSGNDRVPSSFSPSYEAVPRSSDNLKDLESEENFQYSAFKLPLRRIVMTFICD